MPWEWQMVRVEAGSFTMGSRQDNWDERPVHRVTISQPFFMAATEVTNRQYEQFDPAHRALRGKLGYSKEDDEAVIFVSWDEAAAFCAWLSQQEENRTGCRRRPSGSMHAGRHRHSLSHWRVVARSVSEECRGELVSRQEIGQGYGRLARCSDSTQRLGIYDMHGNVEEWCLDWYRPYVAGEQLDPVGRVDGDFRATRGGSHSTTLDYLRSANRSGTLPADKSWLIGLRIVQRKCRRPGRGCQYRQRLECPPGFARRTTGHHTGPRSTQPYFTGPCQYVKQPAADACPVFNRHNHCPALVNCPNGDLLAVWYTCRTEPGRELGIVASRLPYGSETQWQVASGFWTRRTVTITPRRSGLTVMHDLPFQWPLSSGHLGKPGHGDAPETSPATAERPGPKPA